MIATRASIALTEFFIFGKNMDKENLTVSFTRCKFFVEPQCADRQSPGLITLFLLYLSVALSFSIGAPIGHAAPPSTKYHSVYSVPDVPVTDTYIWHEDKIDNTYLVELARSYIDKHYFNETIASNADMLDTLPAYPVHISLRNSGRFIAEGIGIGGPSVTRNVELAIQRTVRMRGRIIENSRKPLLNTDIRKSISIELTLLHSLEKITERDFDTLNRANERGVTGFLMRHQKRISLFAPSKSLIHNYSTRKLLSRLGESVGATASAYKNPNTELYFTKALQLLQMSTDAPVHKLVRGDIPVSFSDVTPPRVANARKSMTQWLASYVRPNGRMEYKYMPSRGRFSRSNNMIRQWMATLALAEVTHGHDIDIESLNSNIQYNLDNFYIEKGALGYIEYNEKAKLGAAAIAALALQSASASELPKEYHRLIATLWHLMQDNGSFRTFLKPASRNDNQSFYSGEALLALARTPGLATREMELAKLQKSMEYYMDYYRSTNRYSPFIPWHTMAYWELYRITKNKTYLSAIYELNDWLLVLQNLDTASPADTLGRFFVSQYAFNGPPHASSTAIYVEGLAYAYNAAVEDDDTKRANAYLTSIKWGLRSLMQLQYDPISAFYLSKKKRVLGGLRTTVSDNQLRIDNTQHAIMAIMAVESLVGLHRLNDASQDNSSWRNEVLARYRASPDGRISDGGPVATLLLGGDTQLGRFTQVWGERYGYDYAFAGLQSEFAQADGLLVNLECVVSTLGAPVSKKGSKVWHLRADPHMLRVFPRKPATIVSVANNHSMDYGTAALMQMTDRLLPQYGIKFSGAGSSLSTAAAPVVLDLGGVHTAFYSSTTIAPEFGATLGNAGYHWIPENDLAAFRNTMAQRLKRYGETADVHVFSVHWGRNYAKRPNTNQRLMARAAIDLGFDMVVGHHSHVLHGIEVYKGKPIFYDLGNFLVDFKFLGLDDVSVLPKVTYTAEKINQIELIPISLRNKQVKIAAGDEANKILDRISSLSRAEGTAISRIKKRAYVLLHE